MGRRWHDMGRKRAAEFGFYMNIKQVLTLLKQKNGCQSGYAQMPSSSSYWLRWQGFSQVQHGKEDLVSAQVEVFQVEVTAKCRPRFSSALQHHLIRLTTGSTDPGSVLRVDFFPCDLEKQPGDVIHWERWVCIRVGVSFILFMLATRQEMNILIPSLH